MQTVSSYVTRKTQTQNLGVPTRTTVTHQEIINGDEFGNLHDEYQGSREEI